jgi:hypothetical protein
MGNCCDKNKKNNSETKQSQFIDNSKVDQSRIELNIINKINVTNNQNQYSYNNFIQTNKKFEMQIIKDSKSNENSVNSNNLNNGLNLMKINNNFQKYGKQEEEEEEKNNINIIIKKRNNKDNENKLKKKINSSTNKLENREPKIELEDLKTTKNEILVKKLTHSKQFDSSLLPMEKKTKLGEEKKKRK